MLDADRTAARLDAYLTVDARSRHARDLVTGPVRQAVRDATPTGTSAHVGGTAAVFADVATAVDRDLRTVFPVAAALIALILVVLLRSLAAPVVLMLSVGLCFAATFGASALVFQHIGGEPGAHGMDPGEDGRTRVRRHFPRSASPGPGRGEANTRPSACDEGVVQGPGHDLVVAPPDEQPAPGQPRDLRRTGLRRGHESGDGGTEPCVNGQADLPGRSNPGKSAAGLGHRSRRGCGRRSRRGCGRRSASRLRATAAPVARGVTADRWGRRLRGSPRDR